MKWSILDTYPQIQKGTSISIEGLHDARMPRLVGADMHIRRSRMEAYTSSQATLAQEEALKFGWYLAWYICGMFEQRVSLMAKNRRCPDVCKTTTLAGRTDVVTCSISSDSLACQANHYFSLCSILSDS
jgi:hypothetical protein